MSSGPHTAPDPSRIRTLADLADALGRLRRRAARPGQVQLSVRDVASRAGRAPSTIDPYLRGTRLAPSDVYEEILLACGVPADGLRPWLDAWERLADNRVSRAAGRAPARKAEILPYSEMRLYRTMRPGGAIGVVTGDIRRVRNVGIWVNSENTGMRMPRIEEYSISAIIRFEGSVRDEAGRVVQDLIADELTRRVAGRVPVAPGTVVTTDAGELLTSNGVRYVIHVAAVHGEPGEGYRQVADIGRCVTNALAEADRLAADGSVTSVLFPLLGTGNAGADLESTVVAMTGAAVDHFTARTGGGIEVVLLLATTADERDVCVRVLDDSPLIRPDQT